MTARSGDRCVIRMVHSLFASTDDWDDQMEGFEDGWPAFFKVLRLYLSHFAGMKVAAALARTNVEAAHLDAWRRLTGRLGLAGVNVGEEWASNAPERLSGIVEHVEQRHVLLRLSQPGPGIALIATYGWGNGTNVNTTFYLYGDDAERRAASSGPLWRD